MAGIAGFHSPIDSINDVISKINPYQVNAAKPSSNTHTFQMDIIQSPFFSIPFESLRAVFLLFSAGPATLFLVELLADTAYVPLLFLVCRSNEIPSLLAESSAVDYPARISNHSRRFRIELPTRPLRNPQPWGAEL